MLNFRNHPHKLLIFWLCIGIALVLSMVVVGGLTRLTHSGLSMVEWSFTGSFPPVTDQGWNTEFDKYKGSPEYKELHSHFTLSDFKSIFWWEYIHRMLGRFIGLVFIIPFLLFLAFKKVPKGILSGLIIILGLGVTQALLGWFMVKSGLVDVPRVSHFRLAAHLTTAFVTCAFIFWVVLEVFHHGRERVQHKVRQLPSAVPLLILLLIQIIYGAFVAGLRAGWVHNTWPLMDGQLVADAVTAMQPMWENFLEGRSGVQFVHRVLAIIVAAIAVHAGWKAIKNGNANSQQSGKWLISLVLVQFTLGVLTLVLEVPVVLGVLHQVVALLLLLSVVAYHYFQRNEFIPSSGKNQ